MKIKSILLFCALMSGVVAVNAAPASISAQPGTTQSGPAYKTVRGIVTDAAGVPVEGVAVFVPGTSRGTTTNADGSFALEAEDGENITFSIIGYGEQVITVSGNAPVRVTLAEDNEMLNELVVIGYGTQKKGDVTSAITSVKAESFNKGQMLDAGDLIQGKVAGLTIANGSGDPNANSTIRLRGVISMEGAQVPLVLVDGIEGSLSTVAPESIESIDVLKDASAAAIYGTRGANGVILITTKNGKRDGNVQVSYSGYASLSNFANTLEFMNVDDIKAGHTDLTDNGANTDWLDVISRDAFSHNHNVNVSGGMENTSFYADFTYRNTQGTIVDTYRKSMNFNAGVSQWLFNDLIKIGFDIQNRHVLSDVVSSSSAYHQAILHNPTDPVYNEDGSFYENFSATNYYNPLAYIKAREGYNRNDNTRLTGNITVEPVKGWQTNLKLATVNSNTNYDYFRNEYDYSNINNGYTGQATLTNYYTRQNLLELTTKYDKNIGKHRIDALAGYSWQYDDYKTFSAYNREFPNYFFGTNNIGLGRALKEGNASMSSYRVDSRLIGFFGRISYGYDNRYNILVSMRHEGSSKFGKNHKWGNFPSVSLGWNIHNEDFMKNVDWINVLKLRAGWGITGVIPDDSYMSLTRYDYDGYYYSGGKWLPGMAIASNPNPELRWEKSNEINLGLDAQFLDNRLGFTLDLYKKVTRDMLFWYEVPTPPNLYDQTLANVGEMTNKGIELAINATPVRKKNFEWNTTMTFSHNVNRLESLSNDIYQASNYQYNGGFGDISSARTHRMEPGQRVDLWYGLKSTGVSENGLWMIENPATGESEEYFVKMDNNEEYCQILGHALPDLYFGMNHSFKIGNFDLNLQFTGQFGFKILNENRVMYESYYFTQYNHLKSLLDAPYADGNALSRNMNSKQWTSAHLENGDFLKLKNASAGYTFQFPNSNYIKSARLYVAGTNLFTITKYSGLDPELSNSDMWYFGHEYSSNYPPVRTFTVGVNLLFGAGKVHRTQPAGPSLADIAALKAAQDALANCNGNVDRLGEQLAASEKARRELEAELAKAKGELAATKTANDYFESPIVAFFEIGKYVLSNSEKERVKMAAKDILANGGKVKFTLSGNADKGTGTMDRNEFLAKERANTVMGIMSEMGVDTSNFSINYGVEDIFDTPELNRCVIIEKQ